MAQYVVTFLPDDTLVAAAVGPYRTRQRAEDIVERLVDALGDSHREEGLVAQVVELMSETEAIATYGHTTTEGTD